MGKQRSFPQYTFTYNTMNINTLHKTFPVVLFCWLLAVPAFSQLVNRGSFSRQPSNNVLDKIIVKVDNQIVLQSDLEQYHMQQVAAGQPDSPELKCNLLRALVQEKLLLARAEVDSVVVADAIVNSELDQRMNYFIAQIGSAQKLEEYYNKSLKDLKDDLRRQIRDQLVAEEMRKKIVGSISVTPREIRKFFNQIPTDSLPYYSTEVEVGQIVKNAVISSSQKKAAREKLEGIRQRILNGEDFQELARLYSEDPETGKEGGYLGWFKKKELVPEYEEASYKLEPGQMSGIVESVFGFHLIQLIGRRGEEYETRHILIKPATSQVDLDETAGILDSVRTLILADSISFAKAAKDNSDDARSKNNGGLLRSPVDGSPYIPLDKIDPAIFFIIDEMQVGDISQPLPYRTEDGKEAMRLIYLKSKTPPHQANLKDDYQKIAAAALNSKRNKAIEEWFNKNKDTVFTEIAPEFGSCNLLQTVY
jgi:peptidyl-prolyl cis-trans isomerase SurA